MDRAKFYLVWVAIGFGSIAFWAVVVLTIEGGLT